MARSNGHKIELTAYDDLFQTDESRAEAKLSKIRDIPIAEIDEFPDHPFKVLLDEDMEQLVESIKRNGVMTPATVRLKEDAPYLRTRFQRVKRKFAEYSCWNSRYISSMKMNVFLPLALFCVMRFRILSRTTSIPIGCNCLPRSRMS